VSDSSECNSKSFNESKVVVEFRLRILYWDQKTG